MKKIILGAVFACSSIMLLSGCNSVSSSIEGSLDSSTQNIVKMGKGEDVGQGTVHLLTPTIAVDDNELEFMTDNFDTNKVTFIYVANEKVFEGTLKNDEDFSVDIENIADAHRTDYQPRVQFVQYADDTESEDIVTFKELRYKVEK